MSQRNEVSRFLEAGYLLAANQLAKFILVESLVILARPLVAISFSAA